VVLVTHEPDIAAFATRLVIVRDGLIVKDERNPAPKSAQAALRELPPPGEGLG